MEATALTLSPEQQDVAEDRGTLFLRGPAGSGKTTAGVARLRRLLEEGVPADSILVLTPQRTLAEPYFAALRAPDLPAGGLTTVLTVGGLAQRAVELFWPLVAEAAGFASVDSLGESTSPDDEPVFLTLETAQYHMARLVRPLLEQGAFSTARIRPHRVYSQVLDNLNKAAVVGFPYTEIAARLQGAWMGEPAQARVYQEAQECARLFREYCLAHNLLDFSLQLETFINHVWPLELCRRYLCGRFRHLIVDNVEEDTPVAHDLLAQWLPHAQSALVIYDEGAGYRRFLGADPESAERLADLCARRTRFTRSHVTTPPIEALAERLSFALRQEPEPPAPAAAEPALVLEHHRYQPQMLDWVADQVADLVRQGVPPAEIVVLAPFLSDSLRFSLATRLEARDVRWRSHRPSRALREEPAARCLLTLADLAHPAWNRRPPEDDVVAALSQAIEGLDPIRAHLLAKIVYRPQLEGVPLTGFERVRADTQERITYLAGQRYDRLLAWLQAYAQGPPATLDHFLSRLFGEVLSQRGFGFYRHPDRGEAAANLIESARKFRWVADQDDGSEVDTAHEYVLMVEDGVMAAQYVGGWRPGPEDAVLLAPAYTFLMANRPVDYQVWLNAGGSGWWERLYQPLTHPHVLSRAWPQGRPWTDADEFRARQEGLQALVRGLLRRCRRRVYLGLSQFGEEGYDERGPLLQAVQRLLRAGENGSHRDTEAQRRE
ncbi:MAG: ATP-dependent helicase, partial [Anaerolineae bacterium]|nr:ATP-dependent helicase [Anaerolineae bacterium]